VESELGKGTTFSIYFPVVEKETVIETETDEKLPAGRMKGCFLLMMKNPLFRYQANQLRTFFNDLWVVFQDHRLSEG
jgi:hypothetical protein